MKILAVSIASGLAFLVIFVWSATIIYHVEFFATLRVMNAFAVSLPVTFATVTFMAIQCVQAWRKLKQLERER